MSRMSEKTNFAVLFFETIFAVFEIHQQAAPGIPGTAVAQRHAT
jgi:hypothetical protein